MGAIRRDKVDHRHRVLDRQSEFRPTCIWLQIDNAKVVIKLRAGIVQRWHAGFTAPRDVQRPQIQRQPQQLAAHIGDNKFVDFIANVAAKTANDVGVDRRNINAACKIGLRIKEGCQQGGLACITVDRRQVVFQTVYGASQHRMAKTINGIREFGQDRRINVGAVVKDKGIDHWLHAAGKFFEHQMLILHFGCETRRLKQAFAIPDQCCWIKSCNHIDHQPFVQKGQTSRRASIFQQRRLVRPDQTVVFGMEDRMHRGQRDIFVATPVACNKVGIQHLVVIGAGKTVVADARVSVGGLPRFLEAVTIRVVHLWGRVMRNVVQERMTCADRPCGRDAAVRVAFLIPDSCVCQVWFHDDLRKAVRTGNELAILVGQQQRHIVHIEIVKFDAQHGQGLRLDFAPVAN